MVRPMLVGEEIGARRLLALGAVGSLAIGLLACGGSASQVGASAPRSTVTSTGLDHDEDSDNLTGGYYDSDDEAIRGFGAVADHADRAAIAGLVRRYYAASLAADGAAACGLMNPVLAETVPESDGQDPEAHGVTCAAVMSKLLARAHAQLLAETRHLTVDSVRVEDEHGFALLSQRGEMANRFIPVRAVHGAWKINSQFGAKLP
jgi:hypothetical protein